MPVQFSILNCKFPNLACLLASKKLQYDCCFGVNLYEYCKNVLVVVRFMFMLGFSVGPFVLFA